MSDYTNEQKLILDEIKKRGFKFEIFEPPFVSILEFYVWSPVKFCICFPELEKISFDWMWPRQLKLRYFNTVEEIFAFMDQNIEKYRRYWEKAD